MHRIIEVKQCFYPKEYNSLSEAVEAATKKSTAELINGKIVLDYQFNGDSIIISFDNGKYLTIRSGEKSIEWDVVSIKPIIKKKIIEQNIYFDFENGDRVFWDWKMILDGFVGKKIAISPSDQFLFIFTQGGEEYMFDVLVDNVNNKFLFLSLA